MYCVGALIGLHLVEPFLSLTTSSNTSYSTLIPAFKQLYEDLTDTDALQLLDLDKPAFKFISKERFEQCKYDSDICEVIAKTGQQMRTQVLSVLTMVLPALAKGFKNQKGIYLASVIGMNLPNMHCQTWTRKSWRKRLFTI